MKENKLFNLQVSASNKFEVNTNSLFYLERRLKRANQGANASLTYKGKEIARGTVGRVLGDVLTYQMDPTRLEESYFV
jgi:hypothetical protein